MPHDTQEQAVALIEMPPPPAPVDELPGPKGAHMTVRQCIMTWTLFAIAAGLIFAALYGMHVYNQNWWADKARAAQAVIDEERVHAEILQTYCLDLLESKLNCTVPRNVTLDREHRIWLKLCVAAIEYNPDRVVMSLEAKAWYDGTAERIYDAYIVPVYYLQVLQGGTG